MESPSAPLRPRRSDRQHGLRAIPRAVWLVTAVHVLAMVVYTTLFPAYRPPDESRHVDLVRHLHRGGHWPTYDERMLARPVAESMALARFAWFGQGEPLPAGEAPGRQPPFREVAPERPSGEPNWIANHPPLYYVAVAATTRVIGAAVGEQPFDRAVAGARLVSLLFAAPLPILAFLTARRLSLPGPAAVTASIVPLAIPQLTHVGAAVNNDTGVTLLVGVLTLLLVHVATGDLTRGRAVAVGLVGAAALLAKGFALFVPAWIGFAYWVAALRTGHPRRATRRVRLALLLTLAGGGWWWVRNVVVFGSIQPAVAQHPLDPELNARLDVWAGNAVRLLPERFWGSFGHWDATIPLPVTVLASVALVTALAVAFERTKPLYRRGHAHGRADVVLLLTPAAAILVIVLAGALRAYLRTGMGAGLQGRYLFPGVVGLAALVAIAVAELRPHRLPYAPVVVFGAAMFVQAVAIASIVPAYWGEPGGWAWHGARALLAWSPWPGVVVVLAWLAFLGAAAATARALARSAALTKANGAADPRATRRRRAPRPAGR